MSIKGYYTISEAAAKLGISRQRVHVLLGIYHLRTERVGPVRLIPTAELARLPTRRPSGYHRIDRKKFPRRG